MNWILLAWFLSVFARVSFVPQIAMHERLHDLGIIFFILILSRMFLWEIFKFSNLKHNAATYFFFCYKVQNRMYLFFVFKSLILETMWVSVYRKELFLFFAKHLTFFRVYRSMLNYGFTAFSSSDPDLPLSTKLKYVCLYVLYACAYHVCEYIVLLETVWCLSWPMQCAFLKNIFGILKNTYNSNTNW